MSSRLSAFIQRALRTVGTLSAVGWLSGCATKDAAPVPAHSERVNGADAQQPVGVSLEGWPSETFALPPGFAPGLPSGTESLRFAPGWRNPNAEDFWSYAFVMWIDEPAPNAARIDELLETYYNGLMAAFAGDRTKEISATPARVDVTRFAPTRYEARMRLIDAFATFEPIELRVVIESFAETDARSSLRIQISRQPKEHAIWQSLRAAIADILARHAGLPAGLSDSASGPR